MTKAGLIEELSRLFEMRRQDAATIIETIFTGMAEALASDEKIEIRGFGTFRIRQRRRRTGRNPKTGASIDVPATRVPFFRAGEEIRRVLAGRPKPPSSTAGHNSEPLLTPSRLPA